MQWTRSFSLRRMFLALLSPLLFANTGLTTNWEARVLAAHNDERAHTGVPSLRWDPALAADARAWADELARTGEFRHAPERDYDPQGENIWGGTRSYYSAEAMVAAWIDEKRAFRPGRFPDNSITGRVEDVGHYTQLVWRDTRAVGCALARSAREDLLVCRYSQAGNYRGEVPY